MRLNYDKNIHYFGRIQFDDGINSMRNPLPGWRDMDKRCLACYGDCIRGSFKNRRSYM